MYSQIPDVTVGREGGAEDAGVDNAAPSSRGGKRGEIWRPKKKWNMLNDKRIKACMTRWHSRIQFLTAVSQSMGAHSEALPVSHITYTVLAGT